MPRDGSGVYTLPAGNPVATATVIASTWANTTLSDVAAQLNNVFTRDGLLGPAAPFKLTDGTIAAPGLAFNSEPGLGMYRPSASNIGWVAAGALIKTLGSAAATSTYISLNPRAVGGSYFQFVNAPAGATNYNVLSMGMDQTHGYITSQKNGSNTDKNLDLTGAAGYTFDSFTMVNPRAVNTDGVSYWINQPSGTAAYARLQVGITGAGGAALFATGIGGAAKPSMYFDALSFAFSGGPLATTGAGNHITSGGGDVYAGTQMALINGSSANPYVRYTSDGWKLVYAAGSLVWQSPTSVNLLTIDGGGNLTIFGSTAVKATGTAWTNPSDIRLKDLQGDYTVGLDKILQLRPRRFKFKKDTGWGTRENVGLIAQEAETVMPETVSIGPGKAGILQFEDMRSFDASAITFALINAVKTLHRRIAELEEPR